MFLICQVSDCYEWVLLPGNKPTRVAPRNGPACGLNGNENDAKYTYLRRWSTTGGIGWPCLIWETCWGMLGCPHIIQFTNKPTVFAGSPFLETAILLRFVGFLRGKPWCFATAIVMVVFPVRLCINGVWQQSIQLTPCWPIA